MRHFRRSVIRILATTCFLLLVAWLSLQFMQYRGDWEAMLRDLRRRIDDSGIVELFETQVIPFFRDTVAPKLREMFGAVRDLLPGNTGT